MRRPLVIEKVKVTSKTTTATVLTTTTTTTEALITTKSLLKCSLLDLWISNNRDKTEKYIFSHLFHKTDFSLKEKKSENPNIFVSLENNKEFHRSTWMPIILP